VSRRTTAAAPGEYRPPVADPRRALEVLLGVPFTRGNQIDVFGDGADFFAEMLAAIRGSRRTVDLLWFIWGKGEITGQVADALVDRARAGVRVRVLLDGFGGRGIGRGQLAAMRRAGCQVAFYRPLLSPRLTTLNLRTHRRALVCDEVTGFTGGAAIDRAWTGRGDRPARWRDTSYRLRGPAVEGLRAAFAIAWLQTPYPVVTEHDRLPTPERPGSAAIQVVSAESQPGWNRGALALHLLLQSATRRVRISTPYARMPASAVEALAQAVRRGVQVQLMTPARAVVDHPFGRIQEEHLYQRFLDSGIEIWHYRPSMLHAKVVTVDGELAMVGTMNVDMRSLAVNEQVALVVDHGATVAVLDAQYEEDLAACTRLTGEEWATRGRGRRAAAAVTYAVGQPVRGLGNWRVTSPRP
jgi:cardiolipin synthase